MKNGGPKLSGQSRPNSGAPIDIMLQLNDSHAWFTTLIPTVHLAGGCPHPTPKAAAWPPCAPPRCGLPIPDSLQLVIHFGQRRAS